MMAASPVIVVAVPFHGSRRRRNFQPVGFAFGPHAQMRIAAILQIAQRAKLEPPSAAAVNARRKTASRHHGLIALVNDLVAPVWIGALHHESEAVRVPRSVRDGQGTRMTQVRGQPLDDGIRPGPPHDAEVKSGHSDTRKDGQYEDDRYRFYQGKPVILIADPG
jgi:hypothetical protein